MSNIQKSWFCPTALPTFAHFCPFWGQQGIFIQKWHHHLKRLMVFYIYAKKYKKRLNSSKDIVIWRIEQSDCSRAFVNKSWKWEFSQIYDWCRKFANHKTLLFRPFLAKSNDSIFHKSPKTLFLPFCGPFLPRKRVKRSKNGQSSWTKSTFLYIAPYWLIRFFWYFAWS